jgi:sporulation protein YlmC with PRC-barrel domain
MNVSDLLGRSVLDLATATTIGQVDDVVIDPSTRRVVGLLLGKTRSNRTWLPFRNVAGLEADAVTISNGHQLAEPPADAVAGISTANALGGRVLTDQGRDIGPLTDIAISADGSVTALFTPNATISASALLGLDSSVVLVTDPATTQ